MAGALDFQPYDRNVQQGMVDGQFASGAFTMIAAGPPRLANIGAGAAGAAAGELTTAAITQPIGLIQNMSLSHNRQFSRIFELGSERSYFVSGRTQGSMSFGRTYYHGPSLLRMMYAAKSDLELPVVVPPFTALSAVAAASDPNPHNTKIRPGFNNLYLNLASDLFSQPIGIMLKMVDSNEQTIGAVYAESCYVPSHAISTDANGLLVQEQVQVMFERIVPVRINSISLIETALEGALGFAANTATTTGAQ